LHSRPTLAALRAGSSAGFPLFAAGGAVSRGFAKGVRKLTYRLSGPNHFFQVAQSDNILM
jgi:hypothetical protein